MSSKRESITVLEECIDLQKRKSQDYQNPNSNIVQAMHYRRGVSTIHDMIHQKLLRAQSLLEPIENGETRTPNFESLEDTYKDLINYASFAVAYIRGEMEGQNFGRDMLNRKLSEEEFKVKSDKYIEEIIAEPQVLSHLDVTGGSASGQVDITKDVLLMNATQMLTNTRELKALEDDGFITHTGIDDCADHREAIRRQGK